MGQLSSAMMRIRVTEERSLTMQRRMQSTEQNMLRINKRLSEEVKFLNSDVSEIKITLEDIKNQISLIINELRTMPKQEDVQVLQKYIEMWEPLNFVTHKDAEAIVKDILDKR